jgi:endoglucanase
MKARVIGAIEAAIDLGVYLIVDWHVLREGDPRIFQDEAVAFLGELARQYGKYPNIIWEIANEPNDEGLTYEVGWKGVVKPYAKAVIAEIRKYDPDNIIVVGTPRWSQDVDAAAEDPITEYDNIMYALHFYAGSHGAELRNKAETAILKGLPVFVTECGLTEANGNGKPDGVEFHEWLRFLSKHNLSWVFWNLSDKKESSAILLPDTDHEGRGGWKESELTDSGAFIRKILRREISR